MDFSDFHYEVDFIVDFIVPGGGGCRRKRTDRNEGTFIVWDSLTKTSNFLCNISRIHVLGGHSVKGGGLQPGQNYDPPSKCTFIVFGGS